MSTDTELHPVQGRWEADDPANAFLDFGPIAEEGGGLLGGEPGEGLLKGTDGCNGVGGWYTPNSAGATIRRGFSTLKACIGVDTWLAATASVRVEGDQLRVFNGAGEEIGVLRKASSEG